mgnify:CR=1 FL=1
MIKFSYDYCTSTTIIFDDEFKVEMVDNLDNIRAKIEWAFSEYDFEYAMVISNETGEILMEAVWEED